MAVKLEVKRLRDDVKLPRFAHTGDMCFDIPVIIDKGDYAPFLLDGDIQEHTPLVVHTDKNGDKYVVIEPQQAVVFHTGLKCATNYGYGLKVHVRSSIGIKKKLILSNATGIIDTAQYRGELLISLTNTGVSPRRIINQERVGQGEVVKVEDVVIVEVDTLSKTERGEGGIGSTGV